MPRYCGARSKHARPGWVWPDWGMRLPLAAEFARAGFQVTGIDIDQRKINSLQRGESYIKDVPTRTLRPLAKKGQLQATTDFSTLMSLDTVNICVPTPLRKTKDPDMSFRVRVPANREVLTSGHAGDSRIHHLPRHHRGTLTPDARKSGLKVGEDFFLCFSPERVDPGNPKYNTANIPKVVGGSPPPARKWARFSTAGTRTGGSRQLDQSCRDGEAPRKHLSSDQHRPGQRNRHDVWPNWHRRLGSHRRGVH